MSFGLSDNAQAVLQAVNKLYHDTNATEKEKASRWLGEFQRSVFAWETADQLLRLKNDVESTYFAAQTMRTKILYSFTELPPDTHESLKESLLTHIEQLCNLSPILTTQLSLAVCDLALQMGSWGMPAVTFMQKYGKEKESLPYLLEILTVLPEEVSNRALRLGDNRRTEIIEEMENSAPMVVDLLKACVDSLKDEKLMCKVFKCLTSWFNLGVLPGNHVARSKLLDVPFNVLRDTSTSSTLHEAASNCICAALYAAEDVARYKDLVQLLYEGSHSLRDAYHNAVAHEDTDKCLNLCRIFTELAESLLEALVGAPGQGLGNLLTLDLLLLCNGHCQYEVAEVTFHLWYRLSEMLYSNNHQELRAVFGPYVERLICSLVRHCQMEPDNEALLDESDDFSDFRHRAAELVRDTVYLVGATRCFNQLFALLDAEGTSPTWDVTEATLFVMSSIAKHVDVTEESVVPQVLQAIIALPPDSHLAVRHTSVRLVGELSAWIDKHATLLDHVLQFLTGALQVKELSSIAALSLQYLCEACRQHMVQHYNALIQLMQVADELNVSADASIGLLKGVVTIISQLPLPYLQEAVSLLCQTQVNMLQQQLQADPKTAHKDPTLWLDRLAAIFRNVELKGRLNNGDPHPCKEVTEVVWHVLKPTLERHQADNKIVERWCRCARFAIRCAGSSVQSTLLAPIAETITSVYAQQPHSCFLYLGSVLVDEFGSDASLLAMLNSFTQPTFAILDQERGLENHPDTVDDLFRLCCRFVENCPGEFLAHPACPAIFQCALAGLRHEHRDANASVCKFLRNVVECRLTAPHDRLVEEALTAYGGQVVEQSLQACLFHIPSYLYPDVAELWWAMLDRDRAAFSNWLMKSLKELPTEITLATATPQQTMQFHAEVVAATAWKTVSYLLRDFCRLYR